MPLSRYRISGTQRMRKTTMTPVATRVLRKISMVMSVEQELSTELMADIRPRAGPRPSAPPDLWEAIAEQNRVRVFAGNGVGVERLRNQPGSTSTNTDKILSAAQEKVPSRAFPAFVLKVFRTMD